MRTFIAILALLSLSACDELNAVLQSAGTVTGPPTESEIASGIREALIVGAGNSVTLTSQPDGFFKNPLIKIPFPPEANKVEEYARKLGFGNQVDQFVETMNHGAEQASAKAKNIFIGAIRQMTLQDVYDIWRGDNDAATQFLRKTTSTQLANEFRPVIKNTLDQVQLTKYWSPLVDNYNKVPFVQKVNPDLNEYVLDETLDGLFLVIAQEEAKIRQDPAARVTDILKRVFGYNGPAVGP